MAFCWSCPMLEGIDAYPHSPGLSRKVHLGEITSRSMITKGRIEFFSI